MKVKKFLLEDSGDKYFTDLIVFDNDVDLEEVRKAVQNVKDAFPTTYTCDDVMRALEELSPFTYTWLGDDAHCGVGEVNVGRLIESRHKKSPLPHRKQD